LLNDKRLFVNFTFVRVHTQRKVPNLPTYLVIAPRLDEVGEVRSVSTLSSLLDQGLFLRDERPVRKHPEQNSHMRYLIYLRYELPTQGNEGPLMHQPDHQQPGCCSQMHLLTIPISILIPIPIQYRRQRCRSTGLY